MRLSDWMAAAPSSQATHDRVAAAYRPALRALGVADDSLAYVVWGDEPEVRFMILAATDAGLATVNVRVNVPGEGPRAAGRLVRWSRVQVGELQVEAHHGRRYVSAQLEGMVLQGVDDAADEVGAWMAEVFRRQEARPSDRPVGP